MYYSYLRYEFVKVDDPFLFRSGSAGCLCSGGSLSQSFQILMYQEYDLAFSFAGDPLQKLKFEHTGDQGEKLVRRIAAQLICK